MKKKTKIVAPLKSTSQHTTGSGNTRRDSWLLSSIFNFTSRSSLNVFVPPSPRSLSITLFILYLYYMNISYVIHRISLSQIQSSFLLVESSSFHYAWAFFFFFRGEGTEGNHKNKFCRLDCNTKKRQKI